MAKRLHTVTDMGNGSAHCSNCNYVLSDKTWHDAPNPCPGCGEVWTDTFPEPYAFGGSDF